MWFVSTRPCRPRPWVRVPLAHPWGRLWLYMDINGFRPRTQPATPSPDWNCQWGPSGVRGPYSLYPRHVRASMLPKKETNYSYNAFQARDRRDKSECDSAVYPSLHGIQGCHLVFFDYFNIKNAPKWLFIWQPGWNMISPVNFAGALTIFAGSCPVGSPWWRGQARLTLWWSSFWQGRVTCWPARPHLIWHDQPAKYQSPITTLLSDGCCSRLQWCFHINHRHARYTVGGVQTVRWAFSYREYKHRLHSGVSHTMDRQLGTVCHQHCETVACHSLHTFKQRLKTCSICIRNTIIRRCCGIFAV